MLRVLFEKGSDVCGNHVVDAFSSLPCSTGSVPNSRARTRTDLVCSLAYAALSLTLSTVVARFQMEAFETTVDGVTVHRDFFVGVPKDGSKGVQATVSRAVKEWEISDRVGGALALGAVESPHETASSCGRACLQ